MLLQPCHLHSDDRSTTSWFLQAPQSMTDRPWTGELIHRKKFNPLNMANDGQTQRRQC